MRTLFPAFAVVSLLSVPAAFGQNNTPLVPSNIDQSSSITSRRPLAPPNAGLSATPEDFARIKLQPGYLLQLQIFDIPEMSADLRIDNRGDINVPVVGSVHVAGDTTSQAEAKVATVLQDKQILNTPSVTLNILQFSSDNVSVLGEVQSPGRVQVLAPRSLGDVLALAGGETIAAGDVIELQHSTSGSPQTPLIVHYSPETGADPLRSTIVYPGDSVFVRRAPVVYVLGAVNRPGGYLMVHGGTLNVLEAISLASGTTLQAALGTIRILRPSDGKTTEIDVPYKDIVRGKLPAPQLKLNDILYVPTSTLKSLLINGSNVISSAAGAAIYRAP